MGVQSYEENKDIIWRALEDLPVAPGEPFETETPVELVRFGSGGYEVVFVDDDNLVDEDGWLNGFTFIPGNMLNTALDVLCERKGFLKPFWSEQNRKKTKELQGQDDIESIGIYSIYEVLKQLLRYRSFDTKTYFDVGQFLINLEETIPHTINDNSGARQRVDVLAGVSSLEKPTDLVDIDGLRVQCLFDIIYESLRQYAFNRRGVRLEECIRCHRLFFSNHGNRGKCTLDEPITNCSTEDSRERASLASKNSQLVKKVRRLCDRGTGQGVYHPDDLAFRKANSKVTSILKKIEIQTIERYKLKHEFLSFIYEKLEAEPNYSIEPLIEEAKEHIGFSRFEESQSRARTE